MMVNGVIAAVARPRGATLLSWDVDLDRISSVIGVELDPASLRA